MNWKWTVKDEFNSDDHYNYYCGQESLQIKGVALITNTRVWNAILGYNLKMTERCLFPWQIIQYHGNSSPCPNHWFQRSWNWSVLWKTTAASRTSNTKDALFIRGLEGKSRESRDICSNSKLGLGLQNKPRRRLAVLCKQKTLITTNTLFQQPKRQFYTWPSPNGQCRNQNDYILCSQKWRSSIQSTKPRPGDDYGSYHELFIAKCKLKLKKAGKTTRSLRLHLNEIPYDYTMEMMKIFQRLDLVGRVPEELWVEICNIVQETVAKTIPKKKKCKKAKWLPEKALWIAEEKRSER